jgi:hypothetical protein
VAFETGLKTFSFSKRKKGNEMFEFIIINDFEKKSMS